MKACVPKQPRPVENLYWSMAKIPVRSQSGMTCLFEFAHTVFAGTDLTSSRGNAQSAKSIIPGHHVVGRVIPLKFK